MRTSDIAAVVVLLLAVAGCDQEQSTFAVGTLERDRIHLAADSSEPIVGVECEEGDRVAAGTVLLRQSTERLRPNVERARAELDAARARLAEAEKGPRAQQIQQSRARLAAASSAVATARLELERQQSLVTQNYTSASTVDILQGRYDEALAQRQEIEAELAQLEEGTRSEVIDAARAEVRAWQATVTELEVALSRAEITAPVAGIVDSLPMEIGERPQPGQTLVVLLAAERLYARVHVPEPIRSRLKPGDAALVRVDGYPEDLPARIRWISADAAFTPYYALTQRDRSRLAYLAEVDLLEPGDIPVGVPVEVRFPGLVQSSP